MKGLDIEFIGVIPFVGQELGYDMNDRVRYLELLDFAEDVIPVSQKYSDRCYLNRNDYLLAKSSAVICYYSGLRGGTMYTYNRTKEAEMQIINIF